MSTTLQPSIIIQDDAVPPISVLNSPPTMHQVIQCLELGEIPGEEEHGNPSAYLTYGKVH